jgi:hypothetical protein
VSSIGIPIKHRNGSSEWYHNISGRLELATGHAAFALTSIGAFGIHLRDRARDVFELRYQETIDLDKDRWELCSRVLSRRDIVDRLSAPW